MDLARRPGAAPLPVHPALWAPGTLEPSLVPPGTPLLKPCPPPLGLSSDTVPRALRTGLSVLLRAQDVLPSAAVAHCSTYTAIFPPLTPGRQPLEAGGLSGRLQLLHSSRALLAARHGHVDTWQAGPRPQAWWSASQRCPQDCVSFVLRGPLRAAVPLEKCAALLTWPHKHGPTCSPEPAPEVGPDSTGSLGPLWSPAPFAGGGSTIVLDDAGRAQEGRSREEHGVARPGSLLGVPLGAAAAGGALPASQDGALPWSALWGLLGSEAQWLGSGARVGV